MFKITHKLCSRDKENSGRNRWFSRGCLTDGIALSGSILDFLLLNDTSFERSILILPWVQTGIGMNNIEPLNPEGWFEEGCVFKGVNKNDDGI